MLDVTYQLPILKMMYEGERQKSEGDLDKELAEKLRAWREKVVEVGRFRDALGEAVDERILNTVVGLNMLEIPTIASCEGHVDRGRAAPWVDIQAPNRPKERFFDEDKIVEATARKYGVPVEDVRRDRHHEAYVEATNTACDNGETPEFQNWQKENDALQKRVVDLLERFYRNRLVAESTRIQVDPSAEGFRMHNGGEDYFRNSRRILNDEERRTLADHLLQYQKEMDAFSEFLREKYFDSQ